MVYKKAGHGFIGRGCKPVYDNKREFKSLNIDPNDALYIDFTMKHHTFVVAMSGGGKSYLAGVFAEELDAQMQNYGVVILDPIGTYSTLNLPNRNTAELSRWNAQTRDNLQPRAIRRTLWIPKGDEAEFKDLGVEYRCFSLRAPEFSKDLFCYAFDLAMLEPQANLFRKAQRALDKAHKKRYDLDDMVSFVRDQGADLHFQSGTVEALVTKLEALQELGIVARDGVDVNDVVKQGEVAVFDLSASSNYTARIVVNFFAEKLLQMRKKAFDLVTRARVTETQVDKPAWYVPPVQLVIDEAHNYIPGNPTLKRCIKEGRNCGVMLTAISQSPDLDRNVYTNITHLFVGKQAFDEDITKIRAMLPVERTPKDFRKQVKQLTTGCFWYYNIDKKSERMVLVRPRYTMHPASTELVDERVYLKDTTEKPQHTNTPPPPEQTAEPEDSEIRRILTSYPPTDRIIVHPRQEEI